MIEQAFMDLLNELKKKNPPLQRQDLFRERSPPEKSTKSRFGL